MRSRRKFPHRLFFGFRKERFSLVLTILVVILIVSALIDETAETRSIDDTNYDRQIDYFNGVIRKWNKSPFDDMKNSTFKVSTTLSGNISGKHSSIMDSKKVQALGLIDSNVKTRDYNSFREDYIEVDFPLSATSIDLDDETPFEFVVTVNGYRHLLKDQLYGLAQDPAECKEYNNPDNDNDVSCIKYHCKHGTQNPDDPSKCFVNHLRTSILVYVDGSTINSSKPNVFIPDNLQRYRMKSHRWDTKTVHLSSLNITIMSTFDPIAAISLDYYNSVWEYPIVERPEGYSPPLGSAALYDTTSVIIMVLFVIIPVYASLFLVCKQRMRDIARSTTNGKKSRRRRKGSPNYTDHENTPFLTKYGEARHSETSAPVLNIEPIPITVPSADFNEEGVIAPSFV